MKLPKPIKKIAIKIISFVLSVPFLKNMVKRFLPQESRLYQKLYHGYHNTNIQAPPPPTPEYAALQHAAQHLAAFEHAMRTSSLDQMKIFQMLLNHDDMLSEGVYDENCY